MTAQNLSFMRYINEVAKKWPEMVLKWQSHWVVLFISNQSLVDYLGLRYILCYVKVSKAPPISTIMTNRAILSVFLPIVHLKVITITAKLYISQKS